MFILLMRHMESEKNVNNSFSTNEELEALTDKGKCLGYQTAHNISSFVKSNKLNVKNIYCASSNRAKMTAKIIANELKVDIKDFPELCSNRSGLLLGKTEKEAMEINPIFMKQLRLFRAGIFSSYNFEEVDGRENKRGFEYRVNNCIDSIIKDNNEETLKIIVLHHSSLTAAIINYARKLYNYPLDFYGRVECGLGKIYLINSQEIILCNDETERLLTVEL